MFQWIEHIFTSTLGGIIGHLFGSIQTGGKGVAKEAGTVVSEHIAKKINENHREVFFKTLAELQKEYQNILSKRIKDAILLNKEDWLINLIGKLLEDEEDKNYKIWLLEQFALLKHNTSGLIGDDLRKEWNRPQKSEFLKAVYMLEDDKILQWIRGGIADLKIIIGDIAITTAETVQILDHQLAPTARNLRNFKHDFIKKTGFGHKPAPAAKTLRNFKEED